MKNIIVLIFMLVVSGSIFASECKVVVNGNDMMQYDATSISVGKNCDNFEITLNHSGQLDKAIMGHNIVIVPTESFNDVIGIINMDAGIDNGFLPEDDRIIAKTAMIGGGESTSITFATSQLNPGTEYTFFCSFPGHYGIMRGKLTI